MKRRDFVRSALAASGAALLAVPSVDAAIPRMKIRRIRYYQPKRFNPSFNQSDRVVTIETDSGITGVGEGGSRDMMEQCAAMLIGEDPARIGHLWQFMYRGWFYPPGREKAHAQGALDIALWDIKGKALGVPVYELLGGLARQHIECYSSGVGRGESPKERAQAVIEAGFRAFRTAPDMPWSGPRRGENPNGVFVPHDAIDQEVEKCRQIREGVGKSGAWITDFHTRFDLAEAVRLCTLLEPLAPLEIEDPVRSENKSVLRSLRSQVRVPIAVGEQFGDRWDQNDLIEDHTIDYARVTLPNAGGITEFMKIAGLCETHYVGMIPHATGPVAVAALVHALGAFPGPALMECSRVPEVPHLPQGPDFRNGKLWPREAPGLGVEFDPKGADLLFEVTERSAPIPLYRRPDGSITNW